MISDSYAIEWLTIANGIYVEYIVFACSIDIDFTCMTATGATEVKLGLNTVLLNDRRMINS